MISHPFEIKPSASSQKIDVLMVTWRGTPAQSIAEIYLPAVQSNAVIALADKIYGRHRLAATDANTLQFPASDLTLIPIPAGAGTYAGLLSVDVRPSLPEGKSCTVSVRQLNVASATSVTQPPPPVIRVERGAFDETPDESQSGGSQKETFSWRTVKGAFQYTITSESPKSLLLGQERLLAWLKWRIGVVPAKSRWLPVLQRYLKYTENLIWTLGKDPNGIPPSEVGNVGDQGGQGSGDKCPLPCEERECTGKVIAIHYDRFGDFRGFEILTESGHERAFRSIEHAIEELVRNAWVERTVVSVFSGEHEPERVDRLVLRRYK